MAITKDDERILKKRFIFRIIGNWGTTFLGPFSSINLGGQLFTVAYELWQTAILSALSATITIGIIFFNEIKEYGEAKLR